jgi:Tfp pilus assembly protein PilE
MEPARPLNNSSQYNPNLQAVANPPPNNSGQPNAQVPDEIKGWSWAAFLMSWVWGIGNNVWIALLGFVPIVNIVMPFILGAKGREWAWQNKRWFSVEHFNAVQKKWVIAWFIIVFVPVTLIFVVGGIGMLGAVAIPNYQSFQSKAKMAEAQAGLYSFYAAEQAYHLELGTYSADFNKLGYDYSSLENYKIGFTNSYDPIFSKYCSDCFVRRDSFKAVAVGNIDGDSTMDVWAIDSNRQLLHLKDDLKY